MAYINTLNYNYDESTRTIIASVNSIKDISEKPIIVTNHITGGEQCFLFKSRTTEKIIFEDTELGLFLIFIEFSDNNISEEIG